MAIIHTSIKQSGTEGVLKLLHAFTEEIVLSTGKILTGQFSHSGCTALKMSLFITEDVYEFIGTRNVFIVDVRDKVAIRFGNRRETLEALAILYRTKNWEEAFPTSQREVYDLCDLDRAARDVSNYLLFGKLPTVPVNSQLRWLFNQVAEASGLFELNVLDTFPNSVPFN